MKKTLIALILLVSVLFAFSVGFSGCARDYTEVKIYVPDGAPALSVANLFSTEKIAGKPLKITITTGIDVQAKVLSGEADAVICPTNMAATLYNKGVDYKLISANLFGLLYLVGTTPVASLSDLKGKVVHSIGKNNTPEFVLKKILASAGIVCLDGDVAVENKVVIKYYSAGSEIIPRLKSGDIEFAVLGEPAATKANVTELFDLQALWKQATGLNESYPQAGVFVKSSLLSNAEFIDGLLQKLRDNTAYIADNSAEVAQLLVEHGSGDFNGTVFTSQTLARCNVRCVEASACKEQLIAYFNAITSVNKSFKLPDDGFYGR